MVPDGVQAPEPCFLSTYYVERTPDISSAPEGGLRGGQLGFKDCLRVPKLPSCPRALGWGGEPCCRWSRFHGDSFSVSRSRRAAITSMPPWTSQICSEQTLTPVPDLGGLRLREVRKLASNHTAVVVGQGLDTRAVRALAAEGRGDLGSSPRWQPGVRE